MKAQEGSRMVLRYSACSLSEQWCLRKHWGGTGIFLFSQGKGWGTAKNQESSLFARPSRSGPLTCSAWSTDARLLFGYQPAETRAKFSNYTLCWYTPALPTPPPLVPYSGGHAKLLPFPYSLLCPHTPY